MPNRAMPLSEMERRARQAFFLSSQERVKERFSEIRAKDLLVN
jgi:hypothetical protein